MITNFTTYHREYYHLRRKRILSQLGDKCVKCGSGSDLQFDHIDPADKAFEISYNLTLEHVEQELTKCQLLCKQCHKLKSAEEQKAKGQHGAYRSYYKHKCRCSKCLLWHENYNNQRVAERRRQQFQKLPGETPVVSSTLTPLTI